MIPKDTLEKLYKEKKLTAFEISEISNLDQESVIQLLIDYHIDPNPTRKKYRLIRRTPLSDQQRQFIVGLLLGNNCHLIKQDKTKFYLTVSSKNQENILLKKMMLGNYVNVINHQQDVFSFRTALLNDLSFFHKLLYQNNKKIIKPELADYLTYFGLSVWFSEASKIKTNNIRLSTFKFSLEDHLVLQRILKVNFDLNVKICEYLKFNQKYYYLSLNKRNSQLLMQKIKPFLDRSSTTDMLNI